MSLFELFLTAVGLSMDAFAVSIGKGLAMPRLNKKHAWIIGLYFGFFQALMPIIGYFLGSHFQRYIQSVDHWAAFLLLGLIGGNMLREGLSAAPERENSDPSVDMRTMLMLAVATSIDALAVGLTFAVLRVPILFSASFVGVTTLIISVCGVFIGHSFGSRWQKHAEQAGGLILLAIGTRILITHLLTGI